MDWLNINNPNYYAVGVNDVTVEDKNGPTKYYFGGYFKKDVMYKECVPKSRMVRSSPILI